MGRRMHEDCLGDASSAKRSSRLKVCMRTPVDIAAWPGRVAKLACVFFANIALPLVEYPHADVRFLWNRISSSEMNTRLSCPNCSRFSTESIVCCSTCDQRHY